MAVNIRQLADINQKRLIGYIFLQKMNKVNLINTNFLQNFYQKFEYIHGLIKSIK